MKEFKREERYIVIKIKDLADNYLDRVKIAAGIKGEAIGALVDAVVVERTWPEYETVWDMLQDRANQSNKTKE